MRLGPRACATTQRWLAGEPVSADPAERRLARRLVSAGLLHPAANLGARAEVTKVTVVIPVRDRPEPLSRLLDALDGLGCVVVDDGSQDAAGIERAARAAGARYLRLEDNAGPAAARNAGLFLVETPFVAFVDSDCVPRPGWLGPLLAHFDDPLVGAVAPRVVAADGPGWLARYEAARSPARHGEPAGPGPAAPRASPTCRPLRSSSAGRSSRGAASTSRCAAGRTWTSCGGASRRAGTCATSRPARWPTTPSAACGSGPCAAPSTARRRGRCRAGTRGDIAAVSLPGWMALAGGLAVARRPVPAAAVVLGAGGLLARRLRGVLDEPGTTAARLMAQRARPGGDPGRDQRRARLVPGAGRRAVVAAPPTNGALCVRARRVGRLADGPAPARLRPLRGGACRRRPLLRPRPVVGLLAGADRAAPARPGDPRLAALEHRGADGAGDGAQAGGPSSSR